MFWLINLYLSDRSSLVKTFHHVVNSFPDHVEIWRFDINIVYKIMINSVQMDGHFRVFRFIKYFINHSCLLVWEMIISPYFLIWNSMKRCLFSPISLININNSQLPPVEDIFSLNFSSFNSPILPFIGLTFISFS